MQRKPSASAKNKLVSGSLISSAGIAEEYAKGTEALIRRMALEVKKELEAMFNHPGYALDAVENGNPASRARILINQILQKYKPVFGKWAKQATDRMISRALKHSERSLEMSLKEISKDFALSPDLMSERLKEVVTASTNEAAQLIKTIPEQYLSEVQGAVMRSITSGTGLKTLVPFLNEKYGQNIRKARNVALDQTRKAFNNINATRLQSAGVKKFEWRHSAGGKHPRKLHQELSGKIFSFDDPPYIGDMYGSAVHGLPGTLPNCRCFMKIVLSFTEEENG